MKRIARFVLFGAVGFGIGGLFPGPASLFAFALGSQQTMFWPPVLIVFGFGFVANEALGETAHGLALRKGRRMIATLALLGAIGFLAGGFVFACGLDGCFQWFLRVSSV